MISHFSFLISHFSFLISHFSFSHFSFLIFSFLVFLIITMFEFKITDNTVELLSIEMSGELNTVAAQDLQGKIVSLDFNKPVFIDVTNLDYISSTGLRYFLLIKKKVEANGHKVTLKGLNKNVASIFKMTGFYSYFEII